MRKYLGLLLFGLLILIIGSCGDTKEIYGEEKLSIAKTWDEFKANAMSDNADISGYLDENYINKYESLLQEARELPRVDFWNVNVLDQFRILSLRHFLSNSGEEGMNLSTSKAIKQFGLLDSKIDSLTFLDSIAMISSELGYVHYNNNGIPKSTKVEKKGEGWKFDFFKELPISIEKQETLIKRRMQLYGSAEMYYSNLIQSKYKAPAMFDPLVLQAEMQ